MTRRKDFALSCVLGSVLLTVIGACSSNSDDSEGSCRPETPATA